jgi:c-di-GMP-binding flagellar brake protein YcgR
MIFDTKPAQMTVPGSGGADDEFSVTKPLEVLSYLQRLIDTRALVNLSSPDGSFLTTMLWWLDPTSRVMGFSVDEKQDGLEQVAGAGESVAVTYLENEKLQFPLLAMRLLRQPQGLALQCDLPAFIIRFQRRKAFRVRVPSFTAPTLRFRMPGDPDHVIVGRVFDLSVGGCSVLVPADTPELPPGTQLPSCRVDLEAEERFVTGFEIRRSVPYESKDSRRQGTLLGCRWTRLSGEAERTLQIYINRQQKRLRTAVPLR